MVKTELLQRTVQAREEGKKKHHLEGGRSWRNRLYGERVQFAPKLPVKRGRCNLGRGG